MKKFLDKFLFTILFSCSLFLLNHNVFANDINRMMIDVKVQDDGSFRVMETWEGNFYEGTENYKSINTSKVTITDFQVGMMDENGNFIEFNYDENYDINNNFDKKKYTCGINVVGNDVELCFGITKYGFNVYVMSYIVNPGVVSYQDYDGFNYMFVNPGLNTPIKNLSTRIMLQNGVPLTSENARIWAFGSNNGTINFVNGSVICDINNFNYNNNQTILLRLDKGIIKPTTTRNESFSDIQNKAFKGSAYEEDPYDRFYRIIIFLVTALFIIVVFIVIFSFFKNEIEKRKFYKNADYYRDLPNKNNIALNAALVADFPIDNVNIYNLIGALMLKMLNEKNLEHIKETNIGFFGVEKKVDSLKLVSIPTNPLCKKLYKIIEIAAGTDGVLQENELSKYAKNNGEVIEDFIKNTLQEGRSELHLMNGYRKTLGKTMRSLNELGKNCLAEVYGLRKYLDDYTLINERGVEEIEIWDNYLVYAQIFGIGDKVLKQLKKLYPDSINKVNTYESNMTMSYLYYRSLTRGITSYRQAKMSSSEISGLGGGMSFGGGGGFSGGGFGGGSR